jgi:replicative superfamily II helicase
MTDEEDFEGYEKDEVQLTQRDIVIESRLKALAINGRDCIKKRDIEGSFNFLQQIENLLPALIKDLEYEFKVDEKLKQTAQKIGQKKQRQQKVKKELNHQAKQALSLLKRELEFFLREYAIAKELHRMARSKHNKKLLEQVNKKTQELESVENRDQWNRNIPKLNEQFKSLGQNPHVSPEIKIKIAQHLKELNIWEHQLLFDTVKKLEPLLKDKKQYNVDWTQLEVATEKILKDLQALTTVDKHLEKLLAGS